MQLTPKKYCVRSISNDMGKCSYYNVNKVGHKLIYLCDDSYVKQYCKRERKKGSIRLRSSF